VAFELPKLPYSLDALAPHISKETLEYHYGKHHKTYVEKLNGLAEGTPYAKMSLEDAIVDAREKNKAPVFNNAAQVWNHTFYWNCLSPRRAQPGKGLSAAIDKSFGSMDAFKEKFTTSAVGLFGSGWAWLVKEKSGNLSIFQTSNAENPLGTANKAILTCDVWEHAYYIDYRNARPKYLETFWNLINWEFAEKNFS
jgi:superoxide dismutase, Fe-Mn family